MLVFCVQPRSAAEIQQHVGLLDRKYFQASYLRPMLEAGLISRTIRYKPRSQLQRDQTTKAGEAQLRRRN